jgi:oligoendopeptidase F
MFSEFEAIAHGMAEAGEPLTHENLTEIYRALNVKYYGGAVVSDTEIGYEWARIPHFYRSFYVYKYATGLTAAVNIANGILTEGAGRAAKYREFLSSGGGDSPVNLLRVAGVDLASEAPYVFAMDEFGRAFGELQSME